MSTPYQIDITMPQYTVDQLKENGYQLFGFKGVQASTKGTPVVWFAADNFSLDTLVNWTEQYQGYTTDASAISGGSVTGSAPYDMDLGQTLDITGQAGTGVVMAGGVPLAITIANQSGVPFTSGISQMVHQNGKLVANPMCAFNLFGTTTLQIAPIEQVLLMFATASYNTGSVVENAFTSGVLIDLTACNSRTVGYDINAGWSWDGGAWCTPVQNNAALAPLLINTPPKSAVSMLSYRPRAHRLALVA